jgi:DNA ligase-1
MLAHVYEDHLKKVTWPAYGQPKLDGFRCIAIVKGGKCKLYSRTQKEWTTLPHLVQQVENLAAGNGIEDMILDGELYNHEFKYDFNRIASIVKRNDVHPDHELVQYHIYDLPSEDQLNFAGRQFALGELFNGMSEFLTRNLKLVETEYLDNEASMQDQMGRFLEQGYEGLMYRNAESFYEGKRSHGLLKVKTFQDAEFKIVGVEEGAGKLQGRAGAFVCVTPRGQKFNVKMVGALDTLSDYLHNYFKYDGKMLTVKYQNLTPDGLPRFPVGIRVREDE